MSLKADGLNDHRYRIYESLRQRPRLHPHHMSRELGFKRNVHNLRVFTNRAIGVKIAAYFSRVLQSRF